MTATPAEHPLAPSWLRVPEDPAALESPVFTSQYARDASGCVTVDSVPVTEIARRHGSPSYVVSERTFRARARGFREAFEAALHPLGVQSAVYYASKALLTTAVARWAADEGLNIDTASGGELAVALAAGIPGERIALHGNNKSAEEIAAALDAGVGRIVVDSLAEIDLVAGLARDRGTRAPVMIRVTPGVHASTHEFIATAHEDQKFGLSLNAEDGDSPALQAVAACLGASDALELRGLHCHIGSQIFAAEGFGQAAERVLALRETVAERWGVSLPELDLGGGHGVAYTAADTPRDVADIAGDLASLLSSALRDSRLPVPHLSFEPGRFIAGPSGCTVYTVGTVKTVTVSPGVRRRYVSVDGGMSDNARPVLYDANYTAVLGSRVSQEPPVLSRVVGKHCESGDVVVKDVYLPGDVHAGDLLVVPVTGAYCWSLASNYNWLARPGIVAVAPDGSTREIVRRESVTDLLARDTGI
ncbi:diaminopimelate decarboxylase [Kocuria tytonis]|uniref:Diaminopimelate decarboxylase n=1 Tax=Kocuria tytonis TaxID=2054280 RepID=A0A495AA08_9MICC|nr:diaminopimelate decarboxylase [Kocuria tytonis]RKQ36672.1 diaminopimelate decarboxylase [Kocuria tytonis]